MSHCGQANDEKKGSDQFSHASTTGKGEVVVGNEIPQYHHTNCKEFGPVELDLTLIDEQVNDKIVDHQAYQRNQDKLSVLYKLLRVGIVKCPHLVEYKIGAGSTDEAQTVGYILIPFGLFFT